MSIEIENIKPLRSHEPVKLLKKNSYPTYQLYAVVNNSKTDANTALKIVILETMSWLRKRFREIDIPVEIQFPEPKDYNLVSDDDFKSFRLDEGYIVEVVYIKDSGIWSFHLAEPDLGPEPGNYTTGRKPVPGRVFETNIAYIINENKQLECGFKTICTEPINSNGPCEVFRPAVVKAIVRNDLLGLRQIYPIVEEPLVVDCIDKIKKLKEFIKSNERQLPLVLIAEYAKTIDTSKIINISSINDGFSYRERIAGNLIIQDIKKLADVPELPINANDLIKYKMSFAQFAIISNKLIDDYNKIIGNGIIIAAGDVRIINPVQHEDEGKLFKYKEISNDKETFIKKLEKYLEEYPKGKNITYGNVKFLNDARIEEQQQIINLSKSKEEIIKAIELKHQDIQQNQLGKMNKLNQEISEKDAKIERLLENIKGKEENDRIWEGRVVDLQKEYSLKINRLEIDIKRKVQLLERPKRPDKIPEWIDKHFSSRLIFHQRAIGLINKAKIDIDMDLLCDSLEYLASEYYDKTFGLIDEQEHNNICRQKYNRPFEVTPSGEVSIRTYPLEYKIKYGFGPTGKLKEVPLETHLKVGKGNSNIIRIYFYIDRNKKLIVVGSLPDHLKISSDKK